MKTALLAIALILSALPASAANPGSRQDQVELSWQACNLRDDLYSTRLEIDRLHNSDNEWTNSWRNWRDSNVFVAPWFADGEHSKALGAYSNDQGTVALMASSWFGLPFGAVLADLDPAKSPKELNRVIDRLWPLTRICPTQTITHCDEKGCVHIPLDGAAGLAPRP